MARSDADLIRCTLGGDDAAFGFLVDKYKGAVHALAYRKVHDFQRAEEITQDTFLQAYQKLSTLRDWRHFPGWLYTITSRFCLMALRRKRLPVQSFEDVSIGEMSQISHEKLTDKKMREDLHDALESLPESDRTVLTLHYLGGLTCEEVGRFIGTSRGAILDRLYRARRRLKKEMLTTVEQALGIYQLPPTLMQQIVERLRPSPRNFRSSRLFHG